MDYEQQATDFLEATGTEFRAELTDHRPYFDDDEDYRDVYEITLKRGKREWKFEFGQSIAHSRKFKIQDSSFSEKDNNLTFSMKAHAEGEMKGKPYLYNRKFSQFVDKFHRVLPIDGAPPTAYNVLACLGDEAGDFEDFCLDYGYNEDSIKVKKVWLKMREQWQNTQMLFSDEEIELLREIQ